MYDPGRCKDFGDCIQKAHGTIIRQNGDGVRIDRDSLKYPELLRDVCVSGALTVCGETLSTKALLNEVRKDVPFYRDSGGVTLSGGEPLAHMEEVLPLLLELKESNISVNVETSLHIQWENVRATMEWTDLYLVDLKHTDPAKFNEFAGGNLHLVLENLARLTEAGARVVIRIPVVPGFNHTMNEMKNILDLAAGLKGVDEVHLLPYHTMGRAKYKMLGREYAMQDHRPVDERELLPYLNYARSVGFIAKTGG